MSFFSGVAVRCIDISLNILCTKLYIISTKSWYTCTLLLPKYSSSIFFLECWFWKILSHNFSIKILYSFGHASVNTLATFRLLYIPTDAFFQEWYYFVWVTLPLLKRSYGSWLKRFGLPKSFLVVWKQNSEIGIIKSPGFGSPLG